MNYLVEASVFKSENRIRVTAQLIEAKNDEHLWSEQYDRELSDVFEVMSDISQEVASEVKVVIAPEVKERMEAIPTENLEAYELYLKGREYHIKFFLSNFFNNSDLNTAIHFYQRAIELDSQFALAYVWLGVAYFSQTYWSDYFKENYADTLKYFADKALSINPDLAEGYWLRGIYYNENGDYDKSINQYEKAIDLNPNYGIAYWRLGDAYEYKSQYINAIINFKKAKKLLIDELYYPELLRNIANKHNNINSILWNLIQCLFAK